MSKVTIRHRFKDLSDYILINGQNVDFILDKNTKYRVFQFETNDDHITIALDKFHPYLVKGWWIKSMLYFVVSLFGIFEPRFRRNYTYNFETIVHLNPDETVVTFGSTLANKDEAITMESTGEAEIINNSKHYDPRIRKRHIGLIWSKISLVLAIIVIIFLTVFLPMILS